MKHVIKSVLEPNNIRYCDYDTGFYDAGLLVHNFGQYETLGDGEVQHTPVYRVGRGRLTDFCLSMAVYMVANPGAHIYGFQLGLEKVPQEEIELLKKVKFKAAKHQWISLHQQKLGTSVHLQHDKRFVEVPDWADGQPYNVWSLYWWATESRGNEMLLRRYAVREQFKEAFGGYFHRHDEAEPWIKELPGDDGTAWKAMREAHRANEARTYAQRLIDGCLHNTKRMAEIAAAKKEEAAA